MSKYRLTTKQDREMFQNAMVNSIKQNDAVSACKKIKSLYKKDQLYLFNWMCSIPNVLSKDDILAEIFDALDPKCKKPSSQIHDGGFKVLVSRLQATSSDKVAPVGTLSLIKKAWHTFTEREKTRVSLWYMATPTPTPGLIPQKFIKDVVDMVLDQYRSTGPLYTTMDADHLKQLDNALSLLDKKAWDNFQKTHPIWIDFLKTEEKAPQIRSRLLRHEIQEQINTTKKSVKGKKM